MTLGISTKEDILEPGLAAGLLSTAALALCARLHGKRGTAPVSAVSHWVWPQEARRTANPAPRHLATGLLIHLTMSVGWAAFNALSLAALRRAIERNGDARPHGALAGLAHMSAARDGAHAANAHDERDEHDRSREHTHRIALAAATTAAAAFGDYIVVPKRFTPGFEYHLPAAHIAAVYVAFGAGLTVPFLLKQWLAGRS